MRSKTFVILLIGLIFTSQNLLSRNLNSDNKSDLDGKTGQTGTTLLDSIVKINQPWSVRLAQSFVFRHPGSVTYDENYTKKKWFYEQGLILEALRQVWQKTENKMYYNFIKENIDSYVNDDGIIRTYPYKDFNVDKINTGRQLLFLYTQTKNNKYKIASDTLRKQIQNQPRTNEGGFWHKKIYPYQMWLDGLYMAEPFYTQYTKMFGDEENYDDIIHQFTSIYNHTLDKKTGLLYHAWDESLEQKWANKKTGTSPHFWGRAIGWYVMAIVDVLDYLPENHNGRDKLITILNEVSETLLKYRDCESGLWYQILDMADREGNYLEASCAAMFTYAFAKGANKSYLDRKFLKIAKESFESIIKIHVTIDQKGFIDLHHTCRSAGLGGNPYRDASFEYYLSEPQRTNDYKGYGPLIMSAIELEKSALLD